MNLKKENIHEFLIPLSIFFIYPLLITLVLFLIKEASQRSTIYGKLVWLEFLMIIFVFIIIFINKKLELILKKLTLAFMYIILIYVVNILIQLSKLKGFFQLTEKYRVSDYLAMEFYLGVDGFSTVLMLLTAILFPLCLISDWVAPAGKVKNFCVLYLILEFLTLNVFMQINILFFYAFFEAVLIPMVLIIGLYGSRERRVYAAYKFFFYTLAGSLIALVGLTLVWVKYRSLNMIFIEYYNNNYVTYDWQKLLWILFFTAFAVKIPMVPFHAWLPEAHAEAPTTGSVLLAGIMLKLGAYGFIRVSCRLFPIGSLYWSSLIYLLSILAVIYISLIAIRQVDLKRIIAYSSIAHMGFVTAGLFSFNMPGYAGAYFIMISHGLVSSALFFCVGVLYDRYKTRSIYYYSGLVTTMPIFSAFFLFFLLANAALPGTSSFIGEFLVITGCLYKNKFLGFMLAINTLLVIVYSLWLFVRLCYGNITCFYAEKYVDLSKKEFFILTILAVGILVLGIYPSLLFKYVNASLFWLEVRCHPTEIILDNIISELVRVVLKK